MPLKGRYIILEKNMNVLIYLNVKKITRKKEARPKKIWTLPEPMLPAPALY